MSKEQLPTPEEFAEMLGKNADDTIDWVISKLEKGKDE